MIEEENEKIANSPICLGTLKTDIHFTSDGYLYHKKCFRKLNFKNPKSRLDIYYYFPVNKVVKGKVYFEKEIKNKFTGYDRDGFDEDGFNKERFDRNGFNRKGFDKDGYNCNKELACKEKLKQAIRENTNNYQYATLRLKHNVDLAIFFVENGGLFSLISKHLRKKKSCDDSS